MTDYMNKAKELGRKAFIDNTYKAPCQDPELMKMLEQGVNSKIMVAWNQGWDSENLK